MLFLSCLTIAFHYITDCSPMPRIIKEDVYENEQAYGGASAFSSDRCHFFGWEDQAMTNYWLGRKGSAVSQFTIDYGCTIEITQFELRNTNHYGWNDVATNGFRIETSSDGIAWTTRVSANLMNPLSTEECDIPLETFETQGNVQARYVRFQAITSHARGSGLMHFRTRYVSKGELQM